MLGEKLCDSHHQHTLISKTFDPGTKYDCSGRKEQGLRSGYRCEHKGCKFVLHEPCFKTFRNKVHFIWFPECEFVFVKKLEILVTGPIKGTPKPQLARCDICAKPIRGYAYASCTHDNVNVHPQCSTLRQHINIGNKPMKLVREIKSDCYVCRTKRVSGVRNSWAYISAPSFLQVHVGCLHNLEDSLKKENSLKKDNNLTKEKIIEKDTQLALPKSSSNSKTNSRHNSTSTVLWKQNRTMKHAMAFARALVAVLGPLKAFVSIGMMIATLISFI